MKTLLRSLFVMSLISGSAMAQIPQARSGDWPWWRGPNRNGIAESGQRVPVSWSKTKNVLWKTNVPGRGHGSPTVVGRRIYLASNIGDTQCVLSFDRDSGKQLWKQVVNKGGLTKRINPKNTHATGTIACDGQRLFIAFYNHESIQAAALDLNAKGKILWTKNCGKFAAIKYPNGYGPSPILYGPYVIIAGDNETDGFIAALSRKTGKVGWKKSRPSKSSYASPVVAHVAGRDQLLIPGCLLVASYNPSSGDLLWQTKATTMQASGSIIWQDDLIFATGGFPTPEVVCIRADNSGKVLWRKNQKVFEQSMLLHKGHIYTINDTGIAHCWHARSGKEVWKKRLRGPLSASPVLVNGNIYLTNEAGTTWVYRASPKGFNQVAKNQLGDEVFASVTICGSRLFFRVSHVSETNQRQEVLYCIAENRQR